MKQPFVLLLGISSITLLPAILAYFEVDLIYMFIVSPFMMLGFWIAVKREAKNVNSGEIDLSKQSKANKVLTYSLAFLFLLVFVMPIVFIVVSDFYG